MNPFRNNLRNVVCGCCDALSCVRRSIREEWRSITILSLETLPPVTFSVSPLMSNNEFLKDPRHTDFARRAETTPHFYIDLDTPPRDRWTPIVKKYLPLLRPLHDQVLREASEVLPCLSRVVPCLTSLLARISLPRDLKEEMHGICAASDGLFTFGELAMMNLGYSLEAGCCGVVVPPSLRRQFPLTHFRNMDWEWDCLRPLTIDVTFLRSKKPVFRITTWVGFVGCLTGMSYANSFSISLNFRRLGSSEGAGKYICNSFAGFLGYWPIEFFIRHVLEKQQQMSFDDVIDTFRTTKLMSPCYLILCGLTGGAILTRDRRSTANIERVVSDGPERLRFVFQTNHDCWKPKPGPESMIRWAGEDDYLLQTTYERRTAGVARLDRFFGVSNPRDGVEDEGEFLVTEEGDGDADGESDSVAVADEDEDDLRKALEKVERVGWKVLNETFPSYNVFTVYSVIMRPGRTPEESRYTSLRLLVDSDEGSGRIADADADTEEEEGEVVV